MFAFDKPLVWLIILVIVMVLFGASRLGDLGKGLGRSIREFKEETGRVEDVSNRVVSITHHQPRAVNGSGEKTASVRSDHDETGKISHG